LRERVEDVVLNRRPDAGERLVEFAPPPWKTGAKTQADELEWRKGSVEERPRARAGQGHRRVDRRGHRGSP